MLRFSLASAIWQFAVKNWSKLYTACLMLVVRSVASQCRQAHEMQTRCKLALLAFPVRRKGSVAPKRILRTMVKVAAAQSVSIT